MQYSEKQLQKILTDGYVTVQREWGGNEQPQPTDKEPVQSKYGNQKTIVSGIEFDSKKEAMYYLELVARRQAGEISNLILQPVYTLQNKQAGIRAIKYIADFEWRDVSTGRTHVHDCKGFETPTFRLKAKLFKAKFPHIVFTYF